MPLGVSRSIWRRNFSHSAWVWRCWHWPITLPSSTFSAANSVVVPWRFVVVRHGLRAALLQRQPALRAVQRLHLTLLVAAQHQGVLGRRHVQTHDVFELLDELRIARHLEAAHDVRLQPVRLPMSPHGAGSNTPLGGQRARAPVGGRRGAGHTRCLPPRLADSARATRTRPMPSCTARSLFCRPCTANKTWSGVQHVSKFPREQSTTLVPIAWQSIGRFPCVLD